MSYSYTEKKRIRKNFGTFAQVMDLPNLVETQTNSYSEFLQADVAPEARKKKGLEEVFQSLFPIKSVSGNADLEYVSYELGKNTYDVQECLIQGLSYSAPLRIKVKLNLYDRDSNFEDVKDTKEGEADYKKQVIELQKFYKKYVVEMDVKFQQFKRKNT